MRKRILLGPAERQAVVRALRDLVTEADDVACAYLFGSFARGEAAADVDLGVLGPLDSVDRIRRCARALQLPLPVDVVSLAEAPLLVRQAAVASRPPLLSHDERKRVDFEVRTMHDWCDLAPHYDEYYRLSFGVHRR